jgi:hypothetical protein
MSFKALTKTNKKESKPTAPAQVNSTLLKM